jgi:hypothetical protein
VLADNKLADPGAEAAIHDRPVDEDRPKAPADKLGSPPAIGM